jgi:hypothetical protein
MAAKIRIYFGARKSEYFCLLVNSTPELSHVEHLPVMIRYESVNESFH